MKESPEQPILIIDFCRSEVWRFWIEAFNEICNDVQAKPRSSPSGLELGGPAKLTTHPYGAVAGSCPACYSSPASCLHSLARRWLPQFNLVPFRIHHPAELAEL